MSDFWTAAEIRRITDRLTSLEELVASNQEYNNNRFTQMTTTTTDYQSQVDAQLQTLTDEVNQEVVARQTLAAEVTTLQSQIAAGAQTVDAAFAQDVLGKVQTLIGLLPPVVPPPVASAANTSSSANASNSTVA